MVLLREMTSADLQPCVEVQRAGAIKGLSHIFPQETHPFPTHQILERWSAHLGDPGVQAYVVEDDTGRIVGFAATKDREFLHFGTAKDMWGTGVAVEAHDLVLVRLRAAGVTDAWLRVFDENHRARRFYERLGWSRTGRRSRSPFAPHPVLLEYARDLAAREA